MSKEIPSEPPSLMDSSSSISRNDPPTTTTTTSSSSSSPNLMTPTLHRHDNNHRILFASCNSQHYETILWPSMQDRNASAFVWVGDAIYADDFYYPETFPQTLYQKPKVKQAKPEDLVKLYDQLLQDPGYAHLTRTSQEVHHVNMTVLGAFDDHDYGINNGDKFYEYKLESATAFVDFLKRSNPEATDLTLMEKRAAAGKGVYGVKVFDFYRAVNDYLLSDEEAGLDLAVPKRETPLSDRTVALFVLDVRSHKDPWVKKWPEKLLPDYAADFLGEEQWEWLEEGLRRSTASVNIIVQGLQVHADRFFDGNVVEDWSRFPVAQHRLYQALLQSNVSVPILVSGDVHMAQLLRRDCGQPSKMTKDDTSSSSNDPRMLLEVTTSGMTHSWGTNICARPHSTIGCRTKYFHKALKAGMHLAHINHAWTDVIDIPETKKIGERGRGQAQEGAKSRYQYSVERNFGEFEFDWEQRQVIIRILGIDVDGDPLLSTTWDFDLLSGKIPPEPTGKVTDADFENGYQRMAPHGGKKDDWYCANYRGEPSTALKLFGVFSPVTLSGIIMVAPAVMISFVLFYLLKFINRNKSKTYMKIKMA